MPRRRAPVALPARPATRPRPRPARCLTGGLAAGALALGVLVAGGAPAGAQAAPGRGDAPVAATAAAVLQGTVVDAESGRPLPGVAVLVRAAGEGAPLATARSDSAGRWRVTLPAPGAYRVRTRRIGFVAAERAVRVDAALRGAAPTTLRLAVAPQVVSLEATVVTASRRLQRLQDAPVAVQLVDRRAIAQSGASNVAAVLDEQLGLQPDGGTPAGIGVQLQGLGAQRVLVLLDGQPLTGRINGNFDLSRIPSTMIRRIEVVQGPQSTLYGSDALGGVINIITRDLGAGRAAWGTGLAAQGGTQGRRDLTASLVGTAGGVRLSGDLGRRDVALAPGRDGDIGTRAGRWDGALKARWAPDSSLALEASSLLLDEEQRYRSGPTWFFADRRQLTGRVGAVWTHGRTRLQPTLHATSFTHLFRRSLLDHPLARLGDHDRQRLAVGELLASHGFARGPVLDGGVSLRRESAASSRVLGIDGAFEGVRARTVTEPFAQLTLGGGRWSVVPGARLTADGTWGTHWTPRVAGMLRPAPRLALRASVGRGFRAPDFKEQYLQFLHLGDGFGYFVRGNPALRPELSDNVSTSVEWAGERLYLRGDLFDNRLRDFIEDRIVGDTAVSGSATPVSYYTYANVGRGRTRGANLEAVVRLGALRAEGGAGWLDARDLGADRPLLGRARRTARLALATAALRGTTGSLTGVWTGRTPVALGSDGRPTERPGWLRLNARVAHTLVRGAVGEWQLEAGVTNLLDRRPELWPGFTGRQLYTGLAWRTGALGFGPER